MNFSKNKYILSNTYYLLSKGAAGEQPNLPNKPFTFKVIQRTVELDPGLSSV